MEALPSAYSVIKYEEKQHASDTAEVMASSFSHDHWPFWKNASPRFAYDVTLLMAKLSDLNYVVIEKETGKAYGQIFCMAPASRMKMIQAIPLLLKIIFLGFTGLYFFDKTAWKHIYALRHFYPFLRKHPNNKPHFEVFLFAMHEKMQGKGLGKKLMDTAIVEMHHRGAEKVILLTDSTMSWQFYERYGYKRIIDISVGPSYKVAMQSNKEFGYIYELDIAKKVESIQQTSLK